MRTLILALLLINLSAGLHVSAQQEIALRMLQPVAGEERNFRGTLRAIV